MSARQPPPEAKLIAAARKAIVPALSMRKAALMADISPTRWRQLEAGMIRVRGKNYPERAPAETLARMALAVGVPAGELLSVGRGDAAAVMAAFSRGQPGAGDSREQELRAMGRDHEGGFLDPEEVEQLISRYRRRRKRPPETRAG